MIFIASEGGGGIKPGGLGICGGERWSGGGVEGLGKCV